MQTQMRPIIVCMVRFKLTNRRVSDVGRRARCRKYPHKYAQTQQNAPQKYAKIWPIFGPNFVPQGISSQELSAGDDDTAA